VTRYAQLDEDRALLPVDERGAPRFFVAVLVPFLPPDETVVVRAEGSSAQAARAFVLRTGGRSLVFTIERCAVSPAPWPESEPASVQDFRVEELLLQEALRQGAARDDCVRWYLATEWVNRRASRNGSKVVANAVVGARYRTWDAAEVHDLEVVRRGGFEPPTPCLKGRSSTGLS
jgi:hypothetical protein